MSHTCALHTTCFHVKCGNGKDTIKWMLLKSLGRMISVAACSLQMDEHRKRTTGIEAASFSVRSTYV